MSDLFDAAVRNQILLERLKASAQEAFQPYLREIAVLVRDRLADEGEVIGTKLALNQLLSDIRTGQIDIYASYNEEFADLLGEVALDQAGMEAESLTKAIIGITADIPPNDVVLSALRNNPLQIENYSGDPLLKSFLRDLTGKQVNIIQTKIQQGYAQGRTVDQIARSIRGTKAQKYKNGELARINRSNRALVHTALQHASTQGRKSTLKKNKDILIGYEWVSTLDSHTSRVCRSLDGRVFEFDKGPLPPIHVACRSTTVAKVNKKYDLASDVVGVRPSSGAGGAKPVSGNTSYYEWLGRQPARFQDSAIGKTRGLLLRNGGLSGDEFAELNLNKNFKPLTLAEMRAKRPEVFENANL